MNPTIDRTTTPVLGVHVDTFDMQHTIAYIRAFLHRPSKGYVCVAGVHGIMEAQRDRELFDVYASSELTIPDGMPLAWVGRLQGHPTMQRVTGPDLMLEIFRSPEFSQTTHFFYGGREGIAEELRNKMSSRFPSTKIVGTYTPPHRELSTQEQDQFAATIRLLKPDIIWVGISCPKQEIFMARHLSGLETKLMFGVGAAFDYHTGHIRDSPQWMKEAGLQWLHRLAQDPRRLWRRYLRNNPAFVWRAGLQLLRFQRRQAPSELQSQETHP